MSASQHAHDLAIDHMAMHVAQPGVETQRATTLRMTHDKGDRNIYKSLHVYILYLCFSYFQVKEILAP